MLIGTHYERPDEHLAAVRARIEAAEARAGLRPNSVVLIAVGKGRPPEAIAALHALGVTDFAESYLQEAVAKMDALGPRPGLIWHFIGRLQSNKTRQVAERFAWVHSLDRLQIARRLSQQRPHYAPPLNVCLQVRLADEPAKSGVEPAELPALAAQVASLERLKLRGLMSLPPASEDIARQRGWFRRLRELLDELNRSGHRLDTLSMGMSGDFETAVEEGATHVRIGTALFGPRQQA